MIDFATYFFVAQGIQMRHSVIVVVKNEPYFHSPGHNFSSSSVQARYIGSSCSRKWFCEFSTFSAMNSPQEKGSPIQLTRTLVASVLENMYALNGATPATDASDDLHISSQYEYATFIHRLKFCNMRKSET